MSLSYSILKKQNDSWSIHLSAEHADTASRGKVLRWLGLALLALAAVIHLLSHQEDLPLAILWFPSCHSYQSFLKHSKSIAEFLPPPIPISLLHLFSLDDKAHLDMTMACALQIRNQRKSYLQQLWAKTNRATDKIRILVPSLKLWLRISVQISLGNYTEICFIQPIAQDFQAHTVSQFVVCAN